MDNDELRARYCPICKQVDLGQTGEYPCLRCGLPTTHDPIQPGEAFDLNEMRRMVSRAITDDETDELALWMVRNGYDVAQRIERGRLDAQMLESRETAGL